MKKKPAPLPWTNATTPYGLLNAVIRVTAEKPERMRMGTACIRGSSLQFTGLRMPDCGAVGCVAGWGIMLMGLTSRNEENSPFRQTALAQRVLGLSSSQARELFYDTRLMRESDQQTPEHARAVIAHTRAFQKKYKAQLQGVTLAETMKGLK